MLAEDQFCRITFEGKEYDSRHGGAFDRGNADSWYSRPRDPHYFKGDSYSSPEVNVREMTQEEVDAYLAGYDYNERFGGKKSWD